MSTVPETPKGRAAAAVSTSNQMPRKCWSCRLISGGGVLLAGLYVLDSARRVARRGTTNSVMVAAQMTFAASLAAMGVVILIDPVGRFQTKKPEDSLEDTQK